MNGDCHAINNNNINNKSFEIDFSNQLQTAFTRGISLVLNEPTQFSLDSKLADSPTNITNIASANLTNLDQNNSERTYEDLSDLLLQHQHKQQSNQLPASTTLAQLEPVRTTTTPTTSHISNAATMILKLNECSMDSQGSSHSSGVGSLKRRLESESTSGPEIKTTPTRRGRKPSSNVAVAEATSSTRRNKFTKEEIIENNRKKTLVYFGNKRVEKDTDEYQKRRERNNDAVKKCREKAEKEQKEREEHMKLLDDENKRLRDKVNSMNKEMEVLKGIIISMRPENKLPENVQALLTEINSMWWWDDAHI